MTDITQRGYARPEALVSTDWVADHLDDPGFASSNRTKTRCSIPRATSLEPSRSTGPGSQRPGAPRLPAARRLRRPDVPVWVATPETTVVFYGDKNNWWACYAFWVFQLFGHTNAQGDGRRPPEVGARRAAPLTRDVPTYPATSYTAPRARRHEIRAFRDEVLDARRSASGRSSMCAAPRNTPARSSTCPTIRKRARCAAATSPARRACPGRAP